ncbi:MAG: fatty acid desaturase [Bryobacteraceae bacterium]|nr:fatty acid desaturase [Bryobacteraceae bacterium]
MTKANNKYAKLNTITTIAIVAFHVGAIASFFFFSWQALWTALFLNWVALSLGIGMGYHRLLTHRSYKVPKAIEYFLTVCATLSLEGGPIFWVGTHRLHHQHSDKEGDPHSPREGGWWAHILWMVYGEGNHNETSVMSKYAPDLARDPFHRWINSNHWIPLTTLGFTLLAIGAITGAAYGAASLVLWGIFLRVTLGHHFTWMVNSVTHMWGERRFMTRDDSTNNWWVALLTFGEGWHNNHHAHPTSARHGLAWYELDVTWLQIWMLGKLGVARNLKVASVKTAVASNVEKAAA